LTNQRDNADVAYVGPMALHVVAATPDPALLGLPWEVPLEQWSEDLLVPLPQGISRHVVRIVRVGSEVLAVKETRERLAMREYRMLRDLQRLSLPVVTPVGVVTGRGTHDGEEIEPALVTLHLRYSLPYRALFSYGLPTESLPKVIDALVVLLVRMHLAGFMWGDVSLSNVLFRRSAGEFSAYVVDAETGELHPSLSDGQRAYDLEVAHVNLCGEMLDLQAGGLLDPNVDPEEIVDLVMERYAALWKELTATEEFATDEMWRVERRVERLNELGFDVQEIDLVAEGGSVQLTPRVVEAGHHQRELQRLVGLDVEENQARRLLNDIASFTKSLDLGAEDRGEVAHRWLTTIFQPVLAMVPAKGRGKLEPAEVFHEILEHRWFLSERAGREIDIFETTRDYIDTVLAERPDIAAAPE
jgi:tRNA A-37 threonylcarbamoyl transferase component Bud32